MCSIDHVRSCVAKSSGLHSLCNQRCCFPDSFQLDPGLKSRTEGSRGVSVEASEMVSIPRAELDALKAELTRLRHEVGRGVAWGRNHDDAGQGDNRPRCTREALVRAWGISM